MQSSGIRPIDDFSESGHNGTSETHERVDLATVDVCAVDMRKRPGVRGPTPRWCQGAGSEEDQGAHRRPQEVLQAVGAGSVNAPLVVIGL